VRPGPAGRSAPQRGGGGGGGGGGSSDDDEPQISMSDRVREAMRASGRRKGLSALVVVVCGILTVIASMLAPRTYESEARILVTRTQALGGDPNGAFAQTGDERKEAAKEYEQQILARDNIIAIVTQAKLIDRWDGMRQPHRKLLDSLGEKIGQKGPSDDQKFEALVRMIESRLKVDIDATTVTLRLEWTEPKAAKDIVAAAVENFQKKRFEVEVGALPEGVKIIQGKADDKRREVLTLFKGLQEAEVANKIKDKTPVPRLISVTQSDPNAAQGDPAIARKLDQVHQDVAQREEQKRQRMAELNNKLAELTATYAPGHPEVIAIKANIAATSQDTPELAALKDQERRLRDEFEASKAARAGEKKTVQVAAPASAGVDAPPIPLTARSVEDIRALYEAAQRSYEQLQLELERKKIAQQTAEAAFKHRYSVTKPAEESIAPKKPVGLIAIAVGAFLTFAMMLVAASLADRFSGIFYEPREVRDRLGVPVFATMKW